MSAIIPQQLLVIVKILVEFGSTAAMESPPPPPTPPQPAEEESRPFKSDNDDHRQHAPAAPDDAVLNLYIAHFLSRWGTRMWEFSVALYMIKIYPGSLLLAAVYGMMASASIALFGPVVGELVDKYPYVNVVKVWLLAQNFSFIIAGAAVIELLLVLDKRGGVGKITFLLLVVIVNVSGAAGVLSTLAGTILVEREWVVVISQAQGPEVLARMNSVIRRIDLLCKLAAPVVSGFIISFVSLFASAVILALWNVFSACLEYWLLMSVHNGIPALSESCRRKRALRPIPNDTETSPLNPPNDDDDDDDNTWLGRLVRLPYISAWKVYLMQEVVLPGIALALLFFNVLSFGILMTAALEWLKVPVYIIGIGRGISAVIGILATFLYPVLESKISTVSAGFLSVWAQWTCLLICAVSIWIPNRLASAYLLMGGVALSRLGLWMFDLSVTQQMQDQVLESERCVVGGVQNSLQSVLELATYLMGMIISDPKDFWKLILISLLVLTHAAALYSIHFYRAWRNNNLQFDRTNKLYQLIPVVQQQRQPS